MVDTLTTTGQVLVVSRLTVNGMHTQVLTVNMIVCHCMHTQINTQVGKTKTHCKFLKPKILYLTLHDLVRGKFFQPSSELQGCKGQEHMY